MNRITSTANNVNFTSFVPGFMCHFSCFLKNSLKLREQPFQIAVVFCLVLLITVQDRICVRQEGWKLMTCYKIVSVLHMHPFFLVIRKNNCTVLPNNFASNKIDIHVDFLPCPVLVINTNQLFRAAPLPTYCEWYELTMNPAQVWMINSGTFKFKFQLSHFLVLWQWASPFISPSHRALNN